MEGTKSNPGRFLHFFFCRERQVVTFWDLVEVVIVVGNASRKTEMSLSINIVKHEDPLGYTWLYIRRNVYYAGEGNKCKETGCKQSRT